MPRETLCAYIASRCVVSGSRREVAPPNERRQTCIIMSHELPLCVSRDPRARLEKHHWFAGSISPCFRLMSRGRLSSSHTRDNTTYTTSTSPPTDDRLPSSPFSSSSPAVTSKCQAAITGRREAGVLIKLSTPQRTRRHITTSYCFVVDRPCSDRT